MDSAHQAQPHNSQPYLYRARFRRNGEDAEVVFCGSVVYSNARNLLQEHFHVNTNSDQCNHFTRKCKSGQVILDREVVHYQIDYKKAGY